MGKLLFPDLEIFIILGYMYQFCPSVATAVVVGFVRNADICINYTLQWQLLSLLVLLEKLSTSWCQRVINEMKKIMNLLMPFFDKTFWCLNDVISNYFVPLKTAVEQLSGRDRSRIAQRSCSSRIFFFCVIWWSLSTTKINIGDVIEK